MKNITLIRRPLPLNLKFKKLYCTLKWKAGRFKNGTIGVRTKGVRVFKVKNPQISYVYRNSGLHMIINFYLLKHPLKLTKLIISSNGIYLYQQATINDNLFSYIYILNFFFLKNIKRVWYFKKLRLNYLIFYFSLLIQVPTNSLVSLIELLPTKGVQYCRSSGSSALLIKSNVRLGTSLVKLPSKIKKVFSLFSSVSPNPVALVEKKKLRNNKAGFLKNLGKKSISRGVARNPIDHPHGGRTKSIKYQRTPWGKTTKKK